MSEITRKEVLSRLRHRYRNAGLEYKTRLIDEAVELFGYHRKAAIRALRRTEGQPAPAYVIGRPREAQASQSHLAGGTATLRQALGGLNAALGGGL